MAWTNPQTDTDARRAKIRTNLGDVDDTAPLVTDETLARYLTDSTNDYQVTSNVALAIAGQFAVEVSNAVGPLKEEAQQRWEHFRQMWADYYKLANGIPPDGSGVGAIPSGAVVATNDGLGRRFSRYDALPGVPRLTRFAP